MLIANEMMKDLSIRMPDSAQNHRNNQSQLELSRNIGGINMQKQKTWKAEMKGIQLSYSNSQISGGATVQAKEGLISDRLIQHQQFKQQSHLKSDLNDHVNNQVSKRKKNRVQNNDGAGN